MRVSSQKSQKGRLFVTCDVCFLTSWCNQTSLWVKAAVAPFADVDHACHSLFSLNLVAISISFASDSQKCPHNYPSMKCLTAKSQ